MREEITDNQTTNPRHAPDATAPTVIGNRLARLRENLNATSVHTKVGKEQMMASDPARGRVMVNVFRAMAVAKVPFTMNFNAGVFVYWTVDNTWSFGQAVLFKNGAVKRALGI